MFTIKSFRYVALSEATSFLVLLVCSAIKQSGGSELGVQILGPVHGALFIFYVACVFNLREPAGWTNKQTFWLLVGAVLPFGGYVADRWLARNEDAAQPAPSATE